MSSFEDESSATKPAATVEQKKVGVSRLPQTLLAAACAAARMLSPRC